MTERPGLLRHLTPCLVVAAALMTSPSMAGDALCDRGRAQSPIDIVATRRQALPALQFEYRSTPLRLVNDGHTVRVRLGANSRLRVGTLPHRLQQFHFHLPAGDRVQGEDFPMAMHFLHKDISGRLVSLVVLFRLGAEHPALDRLLPHLPAPAAAERVVDAAVDATQFLPALRAYYRYEGSLTSPPCTEGVLWIVMKQPLELSMAQLARLRQVIRGPSRPVQPLHGRVVLEGP